MNDLISRQAVIDALELGLENDYVDATEFLTFIKQLPSAEPEQRWIPVTEALPNNAEYDWVLGQIRETNKGYHWIPRQVQYREDKNDWYEESIGWLKENPDRAFEVIAWMRLPEPYRGKE